MNENAFISAHAMLAITDELLGPEYRRSQQDLTEALALTGSRVIDLAMRAEHERENARLLTNFVSLLPNSRLVEPSLQTINGYVATSDEAIVPALASSLVWLRTSKWLTPIDHAKAVLPYYAVGHNNDTGSILLAKPDEVVGEKIKNYENRMLYSTINQKPLLIAEFGKLGSRKAQREVQKVVTASDKFYAPLEAQDVDNMYDRQQRMLKLTHASAYCQLLPKTRLKDLKPVEYLSDEQILSFNVIPTINLMAVRFGVAELLSSLYSPQKKAAQATRRAPKIMPVRLPLNWTHRLF